MEYAVISFTISAGVFIVIWTILDCLINEKQIYHNENINNANNVYAIVGFVLSFFVCFLGVVFSLIGFINTKNKKYQYGGFACAGIIISSLEISALLSFIACYLFYLYH